MAEESGWMQQDAAAEQRSADRRARRHGDLIRRPWTHRHPEPADQVVRSGGGLPAAGSRTAQAFARSLRSAHRRASAFVDGLSDDAKADVGPPLERIIPVAGDRTGVADGGESKAPPRMTAPSPMVGPTGSRMTCPGRRCRRRTSPQAPPRCQRRCLAGIMGYRPARRVRADRRGAGVPVVGVGAFGAPDVAPGNRRPPVPRGALLPFRPPSADNFNPEPLSQWQKRHGVVPQRPA